jgi:outer membrane protein
MWMRTSWIIACLAAAGWATANQPGPHIELSLSRALDRAPDANFDLLIANESVLGAQQATIRSRSQLLPELSLDASQTRARRGFAGGSSTNNRFDALLRARLALLNLNNLAAWQVAKFDVAIAEADLENAVQDVYLEIAVAYFGHLRDLDRLTVIDANLARDRVLLTIAENQLDGGVATPLDVTRAEVQLAGNELARLQQETTVMESALRLKRILNLPLGAQLRLERLTIPAVNPLDSTAVFGLDRVLATRADYRLAQRALDRNRVARRAADWERLPDLSLNADFGYAAPTIGDDMERQWGVGISLSVPIFEGFRIRANQLQADSLVRSQEFRLAQLEQRIEADYLLAAQDLRSRFAQVQVARKTVALNEREFTLARTRFEEGVADNADVVGAQARLAQAEGDLVDAEFAYHSSHVRFSRIVGDIRGIARY